MQNQRVCVCVLVGANKELKVGLQLIGNCKIKVNQKYKIFMADSKSMLETNKIIELVTKKQTNKKSRIKWRKCVRAYLCSRACVCVCSGCTCAL